MLAKEIRQGDRNSSLERTIQYKGAAFQENEAMTIAPIVRIPTCNIKINIY